MFSNQSENQDRRPEKKKRKKIKRLGKTIEVLLDEKKLKRIPEPIKSGNQPEKAEKKGSFSLFRRKMKKKTAIEYAEPGADVHREQGPVDRPMLIIILLLICFGTIMVFSASYAYALDDMGDSYYYIKRQIVFSLAGVVFMLFLSKVDTDIIRKFAPFLFAISVFLLIIVLVLGIAEGAAVRWIKVGSITFQPSEIMKLGMVLMLAYYYSATEKQVRAKGFWKSSLFGTFIPILIVSAVCVLVVLEKHISGTIIMFCIGMAVIFVAGGKLIWFGLAGGAFAAAVYTVIFATDYATKRIDIWAHPENYSERAEVWQTLQGLYAVGSGGFFGVGLGNSRQKHLVVSQPQNDFIFAIVGEELGLIGTFLVLALFVAFVWRCLVIAKRAPDTFSKLAVTGIAAKVGIQAFLNIAVVTNTIPNTGISLPFFSYGGTALIILFVEMGVVLAVSRYSYLQKQ